MYEIECVYVNYCFRNEGRKVYICKVTVHRLSEVSETVVGEQLVSNTENVYAATMRIVAQVFLIFCNVK